MIALIEASNRAAQVDRLAAWLLAASGFVVLLVFGLIVIFAVRYRRGSKASRAPLPIAEWKVEAGWIAGTTLGFLAFFFFGARLFVAMEDASGPADEIRVVGRQWMWDVRQPNGRREFDTLHVPLGTRVRLRMTSEDVIHSFFVPDFRLKQDVIPGKEVLLVFTATRTGRFPLFCTEYCGSKHAQMKGEVIVQRPEDYARWMANAQPPAEVLAHGHNLFLHYGCSGCHDRGSIVHAPSLEGLYGATVPMADGTFRRVDATYLRDCILNPETVRPAGYPPVMPSFRGVVPESDLTEIIAYLEGSVAAP
ncbi:MAG TPA: cytochrome c oxidase subunit II [Opitutaceae bacterium]|jgi:cytochrome c oxidase subunit 2